MQRVATILFLCIALLACPLSCWTGHCCAGATTADSACCCCDEAPADSRHPAKPDCDRQCLCKGAVLTDFTQAPVLSAVGHMPLVNSLETASVSGLDSRLEWAPPRLEAAFSCSNTPMQV